MIQIKAHISNFSENSERLIHQTLQKAPKNDVTLVIKYGEYTVHNVEISGFLCHSDFM